MTTPTGTISLNDVNVELGLSGTTTISMNQANVRTLAGVGGSGTIISMNDLRGKSNRVAISYTFSSNTANASLNISAISGYVAGKSDITVTINSGVYLYATSTANAGLTLTGGTTGDTLTIVNNGYIMGMGGDAPDGSSSYPALPGTPGGTALSIPISATINNTNASAYIGGGGGSGGGCRQANGYGQSIGSTGAGGGAGGGKGGNGYTGSSLSVAGAGGGIGSSGGNGSGFSSGGGGGRIFPSTSVTRSGTSNLPGLGGSGGGSGSITGGPSGTWTGFSVGGGASQTGQAFTTGSPSYAPYISGGGGGWGASGGNGIGFLGTFYTGGSGGKAVALNGNSITWVSGDTARVYGAVS